MTGLPPRHASSRSASALPLEHLLFKLNRSEQEMLKLLNLERFLVDLMIPSDRKALLDRAREQVLDLDTEIVADEAGQDVAVAVLGMALEAQQADRPAGPDDVGQNRAFGNRLGRLEMRVVDGFQVVPATGPRGKAAVGRCAELAQVEIIDPPLRDAGGELALGKARSARGRDGADIDEERDARLRQRIDHGRLGHLLVSDGEDRSFRRGRRHVPAPLFPVAAQVKTIRLPPSAGSATPPAEAI
mgnify:CR=1 FL=1